MDDWIETILIFTKTNKTFFSYGIFLDGLRYNYEVIDIETLELSNPLAVRSSRNQPNHRIQNPNADADMKIIMTVQTLNASNRELGASLSSKVLKI